MFRADGTVCVRALFEDSLAGEEIKEVAVRILVILDEV